MLAKLKRLEMPNSKGWKCHEVLDLAVFQELYTCDRGKQVTCFLFAVLSQPAPTTSRRAKKEAFAHLISEGFPSTLTPLDQPSPLTRGAHGAARQPGGDGIILGIFMGTPFRAVCTATCSGHPDFGPAPSQDKG